MFMKNDYNNSVVFATSNELTKITVVIAPLCYRVYYLLQICMVFSIVVFMLCYLESLILRLLSAVLFLHPLHLVEWGPHEWNRNWDV